MSPSAMDISSNQLRVKLKEFFKHDDFKSSLQKYAIKAILKGMSMIPIAVSISHSTISLQVKEMCTYQCQLAQVNHCAISYLVLCKRIRSLLYFHHCLR